VGSGGLSAKQYRFQVVLGVGLLLAGALLVQLPAPVENLPLGGYLGIFAVLMGATALTPSIIRQTRGLLGPPATALFGISGRLAADNFARAPGRSAVPVAALSIGIAMTIALGGFIGSFKVASQKWLRESVPSDLFATSSYKFGGVRNVPMPEEVGVGIARMPGVSAVDLIRLYPHDVLGLRVYVLSLDPKIYWERAHPTFLEGNLKDVVKAADDGQSVVISENLSRRRHLHRGDMVEIATPTGVHRYPVQAVIIDYTSDQGLLAMSRRMFIRDFKDHLVDTFEIYVDDPAQRLPLRKQITEAYGQKYNLFVLTNDELRAESTNLIDQTFQVTYAMEVVAVLLALLGVVNTLLAAVIDRTREIGLLRAVGATGSQVLASISAEAGCMGLVGAVIGIATGTALAEVLLYCIVKQGSGWDIPLVFPLATALQMGLASIAAAMLAGLYPARRAAALDVVEALAYE
jgi:putative ABC transport system permease protein